MEVWRSASVEGWFWASRCSRTAVEVYGLGLLWVGKGELWEDLVPKRLALRLRAGEAVWELEYG